MKKLAIFTLLMFAATSLWAADAASVLKDALSGGAAGAIGSAASGGDALKGGAIGAGTGIATGAILDALTGPKQPTQGSTSPQVIEKTVVKEVVVDRDDREPPAWGRKKKEAYNDGYRDGKEAGYHDGVLDGYREAMKEVAGYCKEKSR